MSKDELKDLHARVANALAIDAEALRNHPYDLEVGKSGSLLVRWHDQAPDGVIREGALGSYTTRIRPENDFGHQTFVEKFIRRYQSGWILNNSNHSLAAPDLYIIL
jgi:hypothetical protein